MADLDFPPDNIADDTEKRFADPTSEDWAYPEPDRADGATAQNAGAEDPYRGADPAGIFCPPGPRPAREVAHV